MCIRDRPDDIGDLTGQLSLHQHAVAIRVAEIGVHIARSQFHRNTVHDSTLLHRAISLASCSAALKRSRIRSRSVFGVAAPRVDFFWKTCGVNTAAENRTV